MIEEQAAALMITIKSKLPDTQSLLVDARATSYYIRYLEGINYDEAVAVCKHFKEKEYLPAIFEFEEKRVEMFGQPKKSSSEPIVAKKTEASSHIKQAREFLNKAEKIKAEESDGEN